MVVVPCNLAICTQSSALPGGGAVQSVRSSPHRVDGDIMPMPVLTGTEKHRCVRVALDNHLLRGKLVYVYTDTHFAVFLVPQLLCHPFTRRVLCPAVVSDNAYWMLVGSCNPDRPGLIDTIHFFR